MSVATHASLPFSPSGGALVGFDPGGLSDHELVEAMVEARRLASQIQAIELAAVAELARRRFAEAAARDPARDVVVEVLSPADYVYDEVAQALTVTATAADELIRFATELTARLPGTFAALACGAVDYRKARTVWQGTGQIDEGLARTIEAAVLPKAPDQTTGQLRAKIRRLVKRLDPEAAERRREHAEQCRGVELVETEDGVAYLNGVDLPADAAGAAYGRISAIATGLKHDGDARKIDQLRADVYLGLLRGTLTTGEPPTDTTTTRPTPAPPQPGAPGWNAVDDGIAEAIAEIARTELTALTHALTRPHRDTRALITRAGARINQSLADRSLAGRSLAGRSLAERSLAERFPAAPVTVGSGSDRRHDDLGNLLAQAGARITRSLTDLRSRWCVFATDPDPDRDPGPGPGPGSDPGGARPATGADPGAATSDEARSEHGAARYRPPAAMRRLIAYRDRRCCIAGCRRPVRHCDADHTVPYHHGGATCPCNLAMLCRRHHREKATKGWRIEQLWPGVILWITPTGHWRITAPTDRE